MSSEVFTKIFAHIDEVVIDNISNGTQNLLTAISPLIVASFTIYLAFVILSYFDNPPQQIIVDLFKRTFAVLVVVGLSLNISNYNEYVLPVVLNLGDWLSQEFSKGDTSASALDALVTQLIDTVTKNEDELVTLPMPFGLGQYIGAVITNALIIISFGAFLVIASAYILLAKVFMAILGVIGPVFIALFLFPTTRQFAMGWLNQVVNYSLFSLLVNITAGVMLAYLKTTTALETPISNMGLIHTILTTILFLVVLLKLPELASGLVGGIANNGFGGFASSLSSASRMSRIFSGSSKGGAGGKNGGSIAQTKIKPESAGR